MTVRDIRATTACRGFALFFQGLSSVHENQTVLCKTIEKKRLSKNMYVLCEADFLVSRLILESGGKRLR